MRRLEVAPSSVFNFSPESREERRCNSSAALLAAVLAFYGGGVECRVRGGGAGVLRRAGSSGLNRPSWRQRSTGRRAVVGFSGMQ